MLFLPMISTRVCLRNRRAVIRLAHGLKDLSQPLFLAHGAEVLTAGTPEQQPELLEGSWPNRDAKVTVVKFPSMQQDCLNSDTYQAIKHLRTDLITTNFSLAVD